MRRYSWYLQRLKYDGKHNNIITFPMFRRYSWYLQRLKYDQKHKNMFTFAMLRRYSRYLQRLQYDGKHDNIVTFAMFRRYSYGTSSAPKYVYIYIWHLQRLHMAGCFFSVLASLRSTMVSLIDLTVSLKVPRAPRV